MTLVGLSGTACSLDSVLPPNVTDPAITQSPGGAQAAYQGTIAQFRRGFSGNFSGGFVPLSASFSDELLYSDPLDDGSSELDKRRPSGKTDDLYSQLQRVRGQAGQAIGLLTRYIPEDPARVSHTYALQGYAEVFLAEIFCSGIPLSTLDFGGDFTYRSGSTTEEVFRHAAALFDTARTLAGDSTRFVHLAEVGRARASLAMGEYAAAAAAAAAVPDDYRYEVSFTATTVSVGEQPQNFARKTDRWFFSVSDREGLNGLDYRTSGDPRTRATLRSGKWHPDKYDTTGASPMVLASGIEARLIEAEAALQANDPATWLAKLNHLRQTAWPTIRPAVTGPLPDMTDPGTAAGRVDLLFRERAFWLFLTGHRQGDLRRLIRQYGRTQDQIYPVGSYPLGVGGSYGIDVTVAVPPDEQAVNPLYTGCASRGA